MISHRVDQRRGQLIWIVYQTDASYVLFELFCLPQNISASKQTQGNLHFVKGGVSILIAMLSHYIEN